MTTKPEVVLRALHVALHDLVEALDEPRVLVDSKQFVGFLQLLHHLSLGDRYALVIGELFAPRVSHASERFGCEREVDIGEAFNVVLLRRLVGFNYLSFVGSQRLQELVEDGVEFLVEALAVILRLCTMM